MRMFQVTDEGQAAGNFPPINLIDIANVCSVLFLEVISLLACWSLVTHLTPP